VALLACALAASLLASERDAAAEDKPQGAPGEHAESDSAFDVEGAFALGTALYNESYAARPDNTGIAQLRYAGHADFDLIGRHLVLPVDLTMFTHRDRGLRGFVPTEIDGSIGVITTLPLAKGDLELGPRVEHDRGFDEIAFNQTYVDFRARWLYSLAKISPAIARDLDEGDISGWLTLGWFGFNPSYTARPNNTGSALFRYVAHAELSVWKDHVSVGLDTTFFSDRREKNPLRPSELDFIYEIIFREDPWELHLAYERDTPLDQRGLIQAYAFALAVIKFDLAHGEQNAFESRGTIISP
jgi:hypothetical protein